MPGQPRARRTAVSAALVAATLACATALAAVLPHTAAPRVAPSSGIVLADDAGSAALFRLGNLAPGQVFSRCLRLTYRGSTPADVRLSAVGAGSLASFVNLTIEAGTGGGFANCSAFSGTDVYSGTLDDLVSSHTDYASGVGLWASLSAGTGVMRVTAQLADNAPQSQAASLDLSIEAQTDGGLDIVPIPATTPSPTPPTPQTPPTTTARIPTPTPTTAPDPTPTPTVPHSTPTATPTPTTTAAPTSIPKTTATPPTHARITPPTSIPVPPHVRPTVTPKHTPHHTAVVVKPKPQPPTIHPVVRPTDHPPTTYVPKPAHHHSTPTGIQGAVRVIEHAAVATLERAPLPLSLLGLMLLFLIIQDRIDRRDPKLALAAAHADPHVLFSDPPEVPVT